MMGSLTKALTTVLLLTMLAFRALVPMGYMPADADSDFWFELCPDQLPPGFGLNDKSDTGHQHHGSTDDTATVDDGCQIGHMLLSAMLDDPQVDEVVDVTQANTLALRAQTDVLGRRAANYQSRAPPSWTSVKNT